MAKQMESVEVSKETREFGQALVGLVKKSKEALKDGFQFEDVVKVVSEDFKALLVGIQGVEQMPAEEKEDAMAFGRAMGLSVGELTGVFLEKAPAAPQA